jgi:hypothetical protein
VSSPQVAGLFALLKQVHPEWSAAAAKSALMTTASIDVRDNDRVSLADPFDMGAGHVNPGSPAAAGSSFNPGLVYDAGLLEYFGFLCDEGPEVFTEPEATCAFPGEHRGPDHRHGPQRAVDRRVVGAGRQDDPADRHQRGRHHTDLCGVGGRRGRVRRDRVADFVRARPRELADLHRDVRERVRTDRRVASRFAHLDQRGLRRAFADLRQGHAVEAPAQVTGEGEAGSVSFDVSFGYTGDYTPAAHGLEPATVFQDDVAQDPDQSFDPSDVGDGAVAHEITTNGSARLRLAIPPDAVTDPGIDIDLFLYDSAGNEVASSTLAGTDELIDLKVPGRRHVHRVRAWPADPAGTEAPRR